MVKTCPSDQEVQRLAKDTSFEVIRIVQIPAATAALEGVAGAWAAPYGHAARRSLAQKSGFGLLIRAPLHPTTTVSRMASGGTPRKPSSQRSVRIRTIASTRLSRASAEVRPCPGNLKAIGDISGFLLFDNGGETGLVHGNRDLPEFAAFNPRHAR